jgi:hypothetical protein
MHVSWNVRKAGYYMIVVSVEPRANLVVSGFSRTVT